MRAGVALGSNLGKRLQNLQRARKEIEALSSGATAASTVYETEPVNCEADAPSFYNAVIEIEYTGSAPELLRELRGVEERLGRPGDHPRNVSRTIDLDLLYLGDQRSDTPELRLPHPRMRERRFVLAPLADIRAGLVLPNERATVAKLLEHLPELPRVVRASEQW